MIKLPRTRFETTCGDSKHDFFKLHHVPIWKIQRVLYFLSVLFIMDNLLDTHPTQDNFDILKCCLEKLRPAQLERLNDLVQTRPILLHGDFHLRATSQDGLDYILPNTTVPPEHKVIAWSRILEGKEVLCAINLDDDHAVLFATIDDDLHEVNSRMRCLYASELSPAELNVEVRNGKSIRLTIPPHALVIYE